MNTSITMARGEQLTLVDASGQTLSVQAGRLWITQDKEGVDHVVEPGETFTIRSAGATVVSALRPAVIRVLGLQAAAPRLAIAC